VSDGQRPGDLTLDWEENYWKMVPDEMRCVPSFMVGNETGETQRRVTFNRLFLWLQGYPRPFQ